MFFFYDPLGLAKYFSPQSRVILYTLVYYIYSLRLLCSISGVKYLLCIQRVIIYNNCYCDYTFCTFIICHYFIIMHYFFVCMIEREREVNLLMRGVLRLCQVRCGQGDLDHRLFFFFFTVPASSCVYCFDKKTKCSIYGCMSFTASRTLPGLFPPVDFQTVSRRTNTQTHDMHERHVCATSTGFRHNHAHTQYCQYACSSVISMTTTTTSRALWQSVCRTCRSPGFCFIFQLEMLGW